MLRTMLIAGNWKMHMNRQETVGLLRALRTEIQDFDQSNVELAVFPPFTSLETALRELAGCGIALGAQNVFYEEKGAFTGETSAAMLMEAGCRYVLIGHSERRTIFGENDRTVNQKMNICLNKGLIPILCVGETGEERWAGNTFAVLNGQIVFALQGIEEELLERVVIAYEPVWAIGTGLAAGGEAAQEVHTFIRQTLADFTSPETAAKVRIVYGGSMTLATAPALFCQPDVDGGLIGGASLDSNSFSRIYLAARAAAGGRR
ncbi:MAG TPA: triose-phosphate isomerase [Atribacteraceae bacterium]|nr:triose-phosphate isomerase [Atribacteraceae bacterium]